MSEYIRSGQWKVMMSTYDRWAPFCAAAHDYEQDQRSRLIEASEVATHQRVLQGGLSKVTTT